jgi:ABC-2 type transport system ATP-binding protein
MHRPRLLLLDEATTGADVETRAHILELVQRLAEEGSAVLYSTHYLAEVSSLPATVAILDLGTVIARGGVQELVSAHAVPVVELTFHGEAPPLTTTDATPVDHNRLRLTAPDPASALVHVLPELPAGSLASVDIVRPDLEAVYLALTGRRYHEVDAAGVASDGGGGADVPAN